MNPKQTKFVDEYIRTGNATQAATIAGYSAESAAVIGSKLLRNVNVQQAIQLRLDELKNSRTADITEVLEHLTAVMRGQVTEKITTNNGKVFELPVREVDRLSAADKILRVSGAYRDKVSVELSATEKFIAALEKSYAK